MSAITKKLSGVFTPIQIVLAVLVLLGLALGVARLVMGLGDTTGLSDSYPWGIWIAFDVLAVPFSAGAFTLAAITHIFNAKKYHSVARFSLLAGFLGYLLVVLVLLMDLGRWDQFWSVLLPWNWNLHSFMFEVSMSITVYFAVLVLELFAVIFADKDWLPVQLINKVIALVAGVGVLLSTIHQGSLGALFLLLSEKLNAIWWTPILPVLFLVSALFSGLAVTILLGILSWRALGKPRPMQMLSGLARIAAILLAVYLVLKVGDLALAGDLGLVFTSGTLTVLFLVEMIVGVIAPLIIFFSKAANSEKGLLAGAICVLVGLLVNRPTVALFALSPSGPEAYAPTALEIGLLVGAVSFGVLVYSLGLRHLKALREEAH